MQLGTKGHFASVGQQPPGRIDITSRKEGVELVGVPMLLKSPLNGFRVLGGQLLEGRGAEGLADVALGLGDVIAHQSMIGDVRVFMVGRHPCPKAVVSQSEINATFSSRAGRSSIRAALVQGPHHGSTDGLSHRSLRLQLVVIAPDAKEAPERACS